MVVNVERRNWARPGCRWARARASSQYTPIPTAYNKRGFLKGQSHEIYNTFFFFKKLYLGPIGVIGGPAKVESVDRIKLKEVENIMTPSL